MNKTIAFGCILLMMIAAGCKQEACICRSESQGDVMATVNGEPITREDFWTKGQKEMQQMGMKKYWTERAVLERLINGMVLAQRAKKEGMSVEEYEDKMFGDKVGEPAETELEMAYRTLQMTEPFTPPIDETRDKLIEQAMQRQRAYLRRKLALKLRGEGETDVKIFQEGPGVNVEVEGWPSLGPNDAPVTIVEFFNYINFFSVRMRKSINELLDKYKGKIKYVYRDFPPALDEYSERAHLAAHCAGDQGKFFPYSERLFEQGVRLETDDHKRLAQELGLDVKKFNRCLSEKKHLDRIKRSVIEAQEKGVVDAPAYFVNGRLLIGPQPVYAFREIIEGELAKQ